MSSPSASDFSWVSPPVVAGLGGPRATEIIVKYQKQEAPQNQAERLLDIPPGFFTYQPPTDVTSTPPTSPTSMHPSIRLLASLPHTLRYRLQLLTQHVMMIWADLGIWCTRRALLLMRQELRWMLYPRVRRQREWKRAHSGPYQHVFEYEHSIYHIWDMICTTHDSTIDSHTLDYDEWDGTSTAQVYPHSQHRMSTDDLLNYTYFFLSSLDEHLTRVDITSHVWHQLTTPKLDTLVHHIRVHHHPPKPFSCTIITIPSASTSPMASSLIADYLSALATICPSHAYLAPIALYHPSHHSRTQQTLILDAFHQHITHTLICAELPTIASTMNDYHSDVCIFMDMNDSISHCYPYCPKTHVAPVKMMGDAHETTIIPKPWQPEMETALGDAMMMLPIKHIISQPSPTTAQPTTPGPTSTITTPVPTTPLPKPPSDDDNVLGHDTHGDAIVVLSAIQVLEQYAMRVHKIHPTYTITTTTDGSFIATLTLTGASRTFPTITSDPRKQKKHAKNAAAGVLCRVLYQQGELTESILAPNLKVHTSTIKMTPGAIKQASKASGIDISTMSINDKPAQPSAPPSHDVQIRTMDEKHDPLTESHSGRPKKAVGWDRIKVPDVLGGTWIGTQHDMHLYVIKIPLIRTVRNIGFLTQHPLPLHRIPTISIYPEYEQVPYDVGMMYAGKVTLTPEQLSICQQFHLSMFSFILKMTQSEWNTHEKQYIIVPLMEKNEMERKQENENGFFTVKNAAQASSSSENKEPHLEPRDVDWNHHLQEGIRTTTTREDAYFLPSDGFEPSITFPYQARIDFELAETAFTREMHWSDIEHSIPSLQDNLHQFMLVTHYNNQIYQAHRMSRDRTTSSLWPDQNTVYTDYQDYYQKRWSLTVRPNMPLLEAYQFSTAARDALVPGPSQPRQHPLLLVPELCYVHRISTELVTVCKHLPAIFWRLEEYLLVDELRYKIGVRVNYSLLRQALTSGNANENFSYERLEFLGDSFLKFAMTTYLHTKYPHYGEDKLTVMRSNLVDNHSLWELAKKRDLQLYMNTSRFRPKLYRPPGFAPTKQQREDTQQRVLSSKQMADCVEAILCAYYLTPALDGSDEGAKLFLAWMNLPVDGVYDLIVQHQQQPRNPKSVITPAPISLQLISPTPVSQPFPTVPHSPTPSTIVHHFLHTRLPQLQLLLGYVFRDPYHAVQAFTHGSHSADGVPSYQRLEFLGDAIIDLIVTQYMYHIFPSLTPGELTFQRQKLVSNRAFTRVVLKFNLHTLLIHQSHAIITQINEYLSLLPSLSQYELTQVEPPKVLGDLLESLIGAVYIDSGRRMDVVWAVFTKLMHFHVDLRHRQITLI